MGDKTAIDYQQLDSISKKFQQEADELNGVLSQTRGQVENLHGTGWEGRGSDKFFQDMEQQVLPALGRLINALQSTAGIINNIENVYRQATQEAAGPFKNLKI